MNHSDTDSVDKSTSNVSNTTQSFFGGSQGISTTETTSGHEGSKYPPSAVPPNIVVARQEQKAVSVSKGLVFIVLLLAVSAVATVMYLLVKEEESNDFESQFARYSAEIMTSVEQNTHGIFDAMDSFSVQISAYAADTNSTWPFVNPPHWGAMVDRFVNLFGKKSPYVVITPIVKEHLRDNWTEFVKREAPLHYQRNIDYLGINNETSAEELMNKTVPFIHSYNQQREKVPIERPGDAAPMWQRYPLMSPAPSMFTSIDLLDYPNFAPPFLIANATGKPSITLDTFFGSPTSSIVQPIFEKVDTNTAYSPVVAGIWISLEWIEFFYDILPEDINGIAVVLRGSCPKWDRFTNEIIEGSPDTTSSLIINGANATVLEGEYIPSPKHDAMKVSTALVDLEFDASKYSHLGCVPVVTLDIYPTPEFENEFYTSKAIVYTCIVVAIFLFTSLVFLLYDYFVGRTRRKYMERIVAQDKIVSNVFPTAIRERLYHQKDGANMGTDEDALFDLFDFEGGNLSSTPLADLFPNTTVVFADIAGFTAWSSAREPSQVFVLLESIYGAFDKIAYRHNVFKVETVGDCYVAVGGLPEPCEDHALIVAKFARDAMKKMREITRKLEVTLGPDTADLGMRMGIHSGQVTAGVLRGERSRFQLFGDTMNTAARMESSSQANCIQVSQVTADLLIKAGLGGSISPRKSKIFVKGKGDLQTYWLRGTRKMNKKMSPELQTVSEADLDTAGTDNSSSSDSMDFLDHTNGHDLDKSQRLVEWTVEVLSSLLQQIIASRDHHEATVNLAGAESNIGKGDTVLEEFVPIIELKRCRADDLEARRRPSSINIGEAATSQLRDYLTSISAMYRSNAFHNFEHATHVTSSVKKLLKRIVNVDEGKTFGAKNSDSENVNLVDLAGHSYGITSDPLTQFAVVFSAIIHDVDHPGVPNAQLVKENTRTAQMYKKSIAEQNSVQLAWDMLMEEQYQDLRACIYQTDEDLKRFRQLVVNTVMATDIVDKELQALRKARWETAFSTSSLEESLVASEDRKATIVIEHLIQASDVSHTMQHWHIYKKWNERFFMECYGAYKAGRAATDPSINWYKGEIGFFDFYVIPLAKKLDNCGVFGVSSDEYMNYAVSNRDEWVREGEEIVREFIAKFEEKSETNKK